MFTDLQKSAIEGKPAAQEDIDQIRKLVDEVVLSLVQTPDTAAATAVLHEQWDIYGQELRKKIRNRFDTLRIQQNTIRNNGADVRLLTEAFRHLKNIEALHYLKFLDDGHEV